MAELPEKKGHHIQSYGLISLLAVLILGAGGTFYVMQDQPVEKQATTTSIDQNQETAKESKIGDKKTETKKKLPGAVWEKKVAEHYQAPKEAAAKAEPEAGRASLATLLTVLAGNALRSKPIGEHDGLNRFASPPLFEPLALAFDKQVTKEAARVKAQARVSEIKPEGFGQGGLVLLDHPVRPTETELPVLAPLIVTPSMAPDEPLIPELPLEPVIPVEPVLSEKIEKSEKPEKPAPVGPSFNELTEAAQGKLQLVQGEAQALTNQFTELAQQVLQVVQFPTDFANQVTDVKQTWHQVAQLITTYNEWSDQLKGYVAEHPAEFPVSPLLYQTVYQQLQEKVTEIQQMQVQAQTMTQGFNQWVTETQRTNEQLPAWRAAYEITQVPQAEALQAKVQATLQQVTEQPAVSEAVQPVIKDVQAANEALANRQNEITQAFSQMDQAVIEPALQAANIQVTEIETVETEQTEAVKAVVADFTTFVLPEETLVEVLQAPVEPLEEATAPEMDETSVKEGLEPVTDTSSDDLMTQEKIVPTHGEEIHEVNSM